MVFYGPHWALQSHVPSPLLSLRGHFVLWDILVNMLKGYCGIKTFTYTLYVLPKGVVGRAAGEGWNVLQNKRTINTNMADLRRNVKKSAVHRCLGHKRAHYDHGQERGPNGSLSNLTSANQGGSLNDFVIVNLNMPLTAIDYVSIKLVIINSNH